MTQLTVSDILQGSTLLQCVAAPARGIACYLFWKGTCKFSFAKLHGVTAQKYPWKQEPEPGQAEPLSDLLTAGTETGTGRGGGSGRQLFLSQTHFQISLSLSLSLSF